MNASLSGRPLVPRSILVGTDYSAESLHAAKRALELAGTFSARVHLVHAWAAPYTAPVTSGPPTPREEHVHAAQSAVPEHPNLLTLVRDEAEARMAEFAASLRAEDVTLTTSVESGDPRAVLVHYAEVNACDWIVLGKRRLSPVAEWLLGDVAAYLVRHCQVPVLVVPREEAS